MHSATKIFNMEVDEVFFNESKSFLAKAEAYKENCDK